MNIDEAQASVKKKKPNVLVLNVREYKDFYIFQTCPKDTVLLPFVPVVGGYYSVNKKNGAVTTVNLKALSGVEKAKVIDLCGMAALENKLRNQ